MSAEVGFGAPPPDGLGRLFVAVESEVVLGCLLVALEADTAVRITDVAVEAAARERGVGRALVAAALDWARERHARVACVDSADRALGFWRAVGFEGDGSRLERSIAQS